MERIFEIPCPPFNLRLSHLDERYPAIYSKRILCFSLPNSTKEQYKHIGHLLYAAFQATIAELPFLAGSVVRPFRDKPWFHDIQAQGAAYLEIKDYCQEMSFQNLRRACFPSALLDSQKLCPFPKAMYNHDEDYPADVCRLRANFIDGGLLLVVSIIHTVCDGRAITDIIEVFAEKLRQAQNGERAHHSISNGETTKTIYTLDRTAVLSGNGLAGTAENHPAVTIAPMPSISSLINMRTVCTNFHISKKSLVALKQAASLSSSVSTGTNCLPPDNQPNHLSNGSSYISTHDAISALIWRGIMLARHRAGIIPSDHPTNCSTPIDGRSRLALPTPYFGNAIYGSKFTLTVADLAPLQPPGDTSTSNPTTKSQPYSGLNTCTADRFRDLIDYCAHNNRIHYIRVSTSQDLAVGSILLTSYDSFKMHDLDFGPALGGRMEAFRLPSQGLMPGVPVVLPRLRDGSAEFVVNEREDVMRLLGEGDEVWNAFVSKEAGGEVEV